MEIIGAAQFRALPVVGLPEMVKVGQSLSGYTLRELQPQLDPVQELPPGQPDAPQLPQVIFGQAPQRALYFSADDRFVAQLQRDRIAINERRTPQESGADPSSEHVWPELQKLCNCVQTTLAGSDVEYGPHRPTFVELTYVNVIAPADGVWSTHEDLHRVLRIVSGKAGEPPWSKVERAAVRFSFPIHDSDRFTGRLHVAAEPSYAEGMPMLNLNLITRRIIDGPRSLEDVFHACHSDAVEAFVAITTPRMHDYWGRLK
jgi:hypothetical protein